RTTTDPNGDTITTERDGLGRVIAEYGPGNVLTRSIAYDWDHLPISSTETKLPGFGQPDIVRTRYVDGFGRERHELIRTADGAIVEGWKTYDSLGNVSEEALPYEVGTVGFAARPVGAVAQVTAIHRYDVLGRRIQTQLADGRITLTQYSVGSVEDIDA